MYIIQQTSKIAIVLPLFFILFFMLTPKPVLSLAGWSEQTHILKYTQDIYIDFGNPSDMCAPGGLFGTQRCFALFVPKGKFSFDAFLKIHRLVGINIPQQENPASILGRSYATGEWLLYDVGKDEVVYEHKTFERVVEAWRIIGNTGDPVMVDINNLTDYFEETQESRKLREENSGFARFIGIMVIIFFAVYVLLSCLAVSAFIKIVRKKNE